MNTWPIVTSDQLSVSSSFLRLKGGSNQTGSNSLKAFLSYHIHENETDGQPENMTPPAAAVAGVEGLQTQGDCQVIQ